MERTMKTERANDKKYFPSWVLLASSILSLGCVVWCGYLQFQVHHNKWSCIQSPSENLPIRSHHNIQRRGSDGIRGAPGEDRLDRTEGPSRLSLDGVPGSASGGEMESYVRWGRDTCGSGQLLYSEDVSGDTDVRKQQSFIARYAASIESESLTGSGSHDLQCIPVGNGGQSLANTNVTRGPKMSAVKINLLGVTPSRYSTQWASVDGKRLHCTVCMYRSSEKVLKFGDDQCAISGDRWITAYKGFTMAPYKSNGVNLSSGVICVDEKPDADIFPDVMNNTRAPEISFVRSGFGFSQSDKIIRCSLCLRI